MGLDLSKYDNKFKVELGDDGKCKECNQFHSLNIAAKLISDCNGNFDPALHEEYVNAGVVKPKEDNSAVLGEQKIDPVVLLVGNQSPTKMIEGKKYKSKSTGFVGTYMIINNQVMKDFQAVINIETKEVHTLEESIGWEEFIPQKILCKLDGNALHIFGSEFEDLQESPSMFIKLTKKEFKEFKEFQEKL